MYNPYDVLLFLRRRKFAAHWFETGTPAFLVDKLFERQVSSVSLDEMLGTENLLSEFDVNKIGTEALLFQTGYLTITTEEELGGEPLYRLGYPNREVRQSLNRVLLRNLVQDAAQQTANSIRLARLLEAHDCGGPQRTVSRLLRQHSVPVVHQTTTSPITRAFTPACSIPTSAALGYDVAVEESSSHGRLDMAVRTAGHVYLFEFKGGRDGAAGLGARAVAGAPLRRQVPRRRRADPPHRRLSSAAPTRNITAFETADA